MLNRSTVKMLLNVLDNTSLTSSSFTIQVIDSEKDKPFLIIKYKDEDSYQFSVTETKEFNYGERIFEFRRAPGKYKNIEVTQERFGKISDLLKEWSEKIKDELTCDNPIYIDFVAFKENLDQKIGEHLKDGNAHFTDEEKNDLKARLNELEEKFNDLKLKQQITDSELQNVTELINTLDKNMNELPKKAWARSAATKLYELATTLLMSKAGQKLLETSAERLLEAPTQ